jgi:hypothetical protein
MKKKNFIGLFVLLSGSKWNLLKWKAEADGSSAVVAAGGSGGSSSWKKRQKTILILKRKDHF